MSGAFRRSGIYGRRLQWWYPWAYAHWWRPRVFWGGDEWCNDSVAALVPLPGGLVVFWRPGPLRALPCLRCWAELDEATRADYAPCGWLHGGRLRARAHHHVDNWPCDAARQWLLLRTDVAAVLDDDFDDRP